MTHIPPQSLEHFAPQKDFLVCVDSDGCVFDTMGIKQRECFCPWMIAYFDLQPVSEAARECKVFADLFSKTRGANRHVTIKRILTELLPRHPEVKARNFQVPQYPHYFAWVDDPESLLSNEGLHRAIDRAETAEARAELEHVLAWSERVNWSVGEIVKGIPPFLGVNDCLQRLYGKADVVVVSATPIEALKREWSEHRIAHFARLICGQEQGAKTEHIQETAKHYPANHVLMIGDAPGDLSAARANGILFYPVIPGEEDASWEAFHHEGIARFLEESYSGDYEARLIERFEGVLPEDPPWEGAP
jgi:phosphoglycolate phosphatase-like HAD superfamily hydrolase